MQLRLLGCTSRKLGHIEIIVAPFPCKKLGMRPGFYDMALLHDNDLVSVPDGGKTVRDDEAGTGR